MPTKTRTSQREQRSQSSSGLSPSITLDPLTMQRSAGVERSELVRERSELASERSETLADRWATLAEGVPDDRARELASERIEEALDRRRARNLAVMPDGGPLSDEVIDALLAGARTPAEITGPGGLLARLLGRVVERAMEVELTDHGVGSHCTSWVTG